MTNFFLKKRKSEIPRFHKKLKFKLENWEKSIC